MSKVCSVEGCSGVVDARGWCHTHYVQQRRAGLIPVGTRARGTVEERFFTGFSKSDNGCWNWQRRLVGKGYGTIGLGGKGAKQKLVHRLSYEIHKGPIPEGMVVMHKCDNPRCVNPDHLDAGTQSQNIKDAFSRGRKLMPTKKARGEECGASKLTEADVLNVRESKLSFSKLAAAYGVNKSTIERIKYRKTWRHI